MGIKITTNKEHTFDHAPFIVPPGSKILLKDYSPGYTGDLKSKKEGKAALMEDVSRLAEAQTVLWASAQKSVLIIFQAIDAAGKDGAIKHVMSGVNPQGVSVYSFKAPNEEERSHHFLWRFIRKMPARGRITIFNRSYYEEVLVVRIHPEFLESQHLSTETRKLPLEKLWPVRYNAINAFEKMAHDQDTCVIKFFLNVSKEEQKKRFMKRLNDPEKNWKFSADDLKERKHWDKYRQAIEDMLNATSSNISPWHIIPADNKWFARAAIADIITSRIREMNLTFPKATAEQLKNLDIARKALENEK